MVEQRARMTRKHHLSALLALLGALMLYGSAASFADDGANLALSAQTDPTQTPSSQPPSPAEPVPPLRTKRYIRSITIDVGEVFEEKTKFPYHIANELKTSTKEATVRNEILFKEGDPYDEFLIKETARNLRLQRYIRDVVVTPTFDGDAVDVHVHVRDAWTLIPYLSYSSGTGNRNRGIGLTESNFMGGATKIETRYQEEYSRTSAGLIVSDPQFLGTRKNFLVGFADRSDGTVRRLATGLPFRSLKQRDAWSFDWSQSDTIGRLFDAGTESYIFRQHLDNFNALYTFAGPTRKEAHDDAVYSGIYQGQKLLSQRYSVGYSYESDRFYQADLQDYEDLNLNPATVSNDPSELASPRRFSGPLFQYQNIQPNFISMNYIDRFDRVEDYNLGDESLVNLHIAPRSLGSLDNAAIGTANRGRGWKISEHSFLRGEVGGATRVQEDELQNTLLRGEAKYYAVLGDWFVGERYLGRHTFASQFYFDFGERLDRDRQLLLGGDNALRGYDANTFEGDKRIVLNLEERVHIADDIFQLVSLGSAFFIDIGGATRDSVASLVTDDLYGDAGFGLRLCFPRATGGGVVRLDVAFPMRDGPDGSKAWDPRLIAGGGQLFGARLRSEVIGAENSSLGIGFDR